MYFFHCLVWFLFEDVLRFNSRVCRPMSRKSEGTRCCVYEERINLSLGWPFVKLKTRCILRYSRAIEWTWLKRKAEHKIADKSNRVAREREYRRGGGWQKEHVGGKEWRLEGNSRPRSWGWITSGRRALTFLSDAQQIKAIWFARVSRLLPLFSSLSDLNSPHFGSMNLRKKIITE